MLAARLPKNARRLNSNRANDSFVFINDGLLDKRRRPELHHVAWHLDLPFLYMEVWELEIFLFNSIAISRL